MVVARPAETPVTIPAGETDAIADDKLLQVPPDVPVASARLIVAPEQTLSKPVIEPALGSGFTVTAWPIAALPQLKVETE